MKKTVLAAALMLGALASGAAHGQAYISQLMPIAAGFCPAGWLKANGALLPIAQNPALFSLLGTTYGGNGTTTFGLPNVSGTGAMGPPGQKMTWCIATANGTFPKQAKP